jgi:hypothetical protein
LLKLDDEKVYDWLLKLFSENKVKMPDNYYKLNDNPNSTLYTSLIDNYLMFTNDKDLIIDFTNKKKQTPSLSDSNIGKHLDNYSAFARFNMDYTTYPKDVQQYYDSIYSQKDKGGLRKKLSELRFEPIDSYSAKFIMEFKDKEVNSLKQILN